MGKVTSNGRHAPVTGTSGRPKITPETRTAPLFKADLPPVGLVQTPAASSNASTGESWIDQLPKATPAKGAFEIIHPRQGDWPVLDPATLAEPVAALGIKPPVERFTAGQTVTTTIKGDTVKGEYVGVDHKGRGVLSSGGERRIAKLDDINAVGPTRPQVGPLAGLPAGAVVEPPTKLKNALDASLDIEVTGKHTAREYIDALQAEGYSVYLVGGAIRDAVYMLAKTPDASIDDVKATLKDIDIVTTAPPPVIRRIAKEVAPEYPNGAVWSPPTVDQFGAVLVGGPKAGLPNPEGIDIVSIRVAGHFAEQSLSADTDEKTFPYTFGKSIVEDTDGRDFACNALYYDPLNGAMVDPTGQGIADAQNKFLRVTRDNLVEDKSVSLRYFKFRMRGYTTDKKNLKALRYHANKTLWGPKWQISLNVARIAPKDVRTAGQVSDWIGKLGKIMHADGVGKAFNKRVMPEMAKISKRIQKKFK